MIFFHCLTHVVGEQKMKIDNYTLSNGTNIPCIGYGTYKTPNNDVGLNVIKDAINTGYRHIDTAQAYGNEQLVGQAIKESGFPRGDFFITSKIANSNQGYQSTLESFQQSCNKLQTDYIDLLLIHWPIPIGKNNEWKALNIDTWKAMEQLYRSNRVRSIGVSNFLIHHLENLLSHSTIKPMVNQLEFHIKYQQREIVDFCMKNNILVESWGPLMRGEAIHHPILLSLADKYKKDVAQISIKYCLQKKLCPLPKTTKLDRMKSNLDVFDFTITDADMQILDACNTTDSYVFHPDRNNEWQATIDKMNEGVK